MSGKTVQPGSRVTLHYRLACQGQELVNTFTEQAPESFRLGAGEIDPRLEVLLLGLAANDHRTWHLDAGEAFGHREAALVHDLPRADFAPDSPLSEGLQMAFDLPNGQSMHGILRAIGEEAVTVDFNHPLAGLAVEFEVKILSVE